MSGWECKTCDRTQNSSSQQMPCKMETCVEFPMAPQIAAVEHRKSYDVAGFPLELECLDDGQGTEGRNCELERENGGECWSEKTARNGAGTVVETLAQDWSSLDREMQYECAGGHQRSYAKLGWTCGKDGLQRNLCEGSEMSRPPMVEMETAKLERVERDKWSGPHPQRFEIYRWEDMVAGQVSKFVGNADGLSKTVQDNTGWLHLAQKPWKLEAIFEMWKEPLYRWSRVPRGPKRVRHDWDECSGCLADREKNCEGEIWRALATPLSVSSQLGHCRDAIMVQSCWVWLVGIV